MTFLMCLGVAAAVRFNPVQDPPTLKELARRRRLTLGSAAPIDLLKSGGDGGKFPDTLSAQFNLMEPENDFKPPSLWLGEGKYNWTNADWLLGEPGKPGWAKEHGMRVRGHVLVYARDDGYTVPRWLRAEESDINPEKAKTLLRDYIHTVVGRYKGKVAMWDVANEAIDDRPNQNPFNLRNSFWFRKLGPEFLVLAFQYAHEADPRAGLYYNDYAIEGGGPKADHVLDLLKWLKQNHAPVTGLGMQWHTDLNLKLAPGDEHYKFADRVRDAGFTFMITELDVAVPIARSTRSSPTFGTVPANPDDLQKQADVYRAIFEYALSYRNCRGIQVWGFDDLHSWIPGFSGGRNGAATLFDADYKPKPAYMAVADVLEGKQAR